MPTVKIRIPSPAACLAAAMPSAPSSSPSVKMISARVCPSALPNASRAAVTAAAILVPPFGITVVLGKVIWILACYKQPSLFVKMKIIIYESIQKNR
jgi:hypothetical protein